MHLNLDFRLVAGAVFLALTIVGCVVLYFYLQQRKKGTSVKV
jgi:hypothetical protein